MSFIKFYKIQFSTKAMQSFSTINLQQKYPLKLKFFPWKIWFSKAFIWAALQTQFFTGTYSIINIAIINYFMMETAHAYSDATVQ